MSTDSQSSYERQELDVNLYVVLTIAIVVTGAIYLLLLPFKDTFLGILLYERGFTQYIVILLSSIVATLTIFKYFKISKESKAIKKLWIPETVPWIDPNSRQINSLQHNLAKDNSIIASRCQRIIAAYQKSSSRQTATELALDDSSFYLSASESSYTLPKILIWAIPLLGFIGTVIGISGAVTGFSSFLEETGEIEQIKEGIGTVTGGLATAFDTTLLALCLSVLVMIPLVIVERLESRLLLAIDIYINDQLLPKLKGNKDTLGDSININQAIKEGLQEHLPTPEELIKPVEEYAQKAVSKFVDNFVQEIDKIQTVSDKLIEQMKQVTEMSIGDRQDFISSFDKQQETNTEIITQVRQLIAEINQNSSTISQDLNRQTEAVTYQLTQATRQLENSLHILEESTTKIAEINKLQQSLSQFIHSLEETAEMKPILEEVKINIAQLKPSLENIGKPRRLTLLEQVDSQDNNS